MRANEFVKKFGLEHTKYLIEDTELSEFAIHSSCAGKYSMDTVSTDDLKRLVESHELVESVGGWSNATALYDEHLDKDLGRSIADVESCQ